MTCIRCDGTGLLRKKVPVDPRIYGEPREATVTYPCPCQRQQATEVFDGKAAGAGD